MQHLQKSEGRATPPIPELQTFQPSTFKVPRVLIYNKLSGSISTSTAVSGIFFASQYAIAPPSSFVSTERFGDFSRNLNRCSFFNRASGRIRHALWRIHPRTCVGTHC